MEPNAGLERSECDEGTWLMADKRDFASIAMPHIEAVYRAAIALARRREDAEELVQMTYVKALERFASFTPGTNCKAWLVQILRNTWIDELRHRKVVGPTVDIDERRLPAADPPQGEDGTAGNARDVLELIADDEVRRAMAELPEDQRLTLMLVDVEGLSQDEVATIMGVAAGTVKSRTSRARESLRLKLIDHARDLGLSGRGR
jgi:RNA polymerase sigma-70 factor, ECF subfamily